MNPAQELGGGEPCCCISHEFLRSASRDPGRIAVVHALGGLRIFRELREASHREDDPVGVDKEERLLEASRERASPPVYLGDVCFTYGEVLSAVESLSRRIRRVLDGGGDPGLFRPKGFVYGERVSGTHISESSCGFRRMPQIVGVHIGPSVEYIVAILSILRCGEAFLPLDPSLPQERSVSVAARSRADLIITCAVSSNGSRSRQSNVAVWTADGHEFSVLCFTMGSDLANGVASDLDWPCETKCRRLYCYLMYTSGSTGKPKGVCGTEIGLVNRFSWMQQFFPVGREDILLFKTPVNFIDHLQEFLVAILSSTPLIIPPFNELKADPFYLVDVLKVYCISRLVIVPSLARAVLPSSQRSHWMDVQKTLRLLVLSGEILSISLWDRLHRLLPETIVLNLYGSTEVSGDCTYFDCSYLPKILESEALSSVPIGVPISNCDITFLQQGTPDVGEICVGGSCLFAGYFDDLSPESLSQDNHTPLCFRTGDFAKRLRSGDLLFIGRKDRTVKINGQRIALEEIEDALREHPKVIDAAVVSESVGEPCGQIYLKAYIILLENAGIGDKQFPSLNQKNADRFLVISIRSWLARKLSLAMIPSYYFFIESLPLSSSGKVDYALLESSTSISKHSIKELDETQCFGDILQIIKQAFCDALLIVEISDHDDFFLMGGNSISAALLAHRLGIDMRLLYRFPSPAGLLDALIDGKSPHESAFYHDDLQAKRLKLDYASKEVNADRPKIFVNSGHPLRRLDSIKFSDPKSATSADHSFQISKLNLPRLCSFNRCNRFTHGEVPEVGEIKQYCLTTETPRSKTWDLKEIWKVPLESCVDASPLLVLKNDEFLLFIGSHSHIFLCVDALSGFVQWKTHLDGRIECSAATTSDFSHIVVGCYEGKIYFLNFMSGVISWAFQTHGEVKMQPVAWKNLVWCGSHDHWLYALDYLQQCCVYKISCGGSPYGSPSVDMVRNMIYVASTSGRVTAISVEICAIEAVQASSHSVTGWLALDGLLGADTGANTSPYRVAWLYESSAPIFGSLSFDSLTGNVICCLVDGRVIALNSKGSVVWEVVTGGPVFAGACMSYALPSQVLVCSRNGSIYSFESESGDPVWEYQVGDPVTSSAYINEHIQLISKPSDVIHRLVCVCSSSGSIRVLRIRSDAAQQRRQLAQDVMGSGMVEEMARMDLPADIFSSPVMVGGLLFVGCRDDHVRCINTIPDELLSDSRNPLSLD